LAAGRGPFLDIRAGTYMVRQLPPRFENLKKRQVKAPKIFLRDSGVLHALLGIEPRSGLQSHPNLGASWEGFGMEQILSLTGDRQAYFWATHAGAELDLLILRGFQRLGFGFKYSEQPSTTKSMRVAQQDLGLHHLYVIHPGHHEFPLAPAITVLPLRRALDLLS
jgi:predicted AAA+ superfamily ATPase